MKAGLEGEGDHHWFMTRVSSEYYEARQYRVAAEWARRSLRVRPRCPLAMWDLAGALDALGREKQSIRLWEAILAMPLRTVAFGRCGEGLSWARSLRADARFRLGKALMKGPRFEQARRLLKAYIRDRKAGVESLYSLREVHAALAQRSS